MGLGMLREAIEKLDEPCGVTRDEMIDAFALHDQSTAWLTAAVGGFDRDEVYELDGAGSAISWIKHHCRQAGGDAARIMITARKLHALPHVAAAYRSGELGSGHVRAVGNVAERHVDKFAEVEDTMVPALAGLSVSDAVTVMQQWANAASDADPDPEPGERPDVLHVSETMDGRRERTGHLSPESAVEVEEALAHAANGADRNLSVAERNAQALVAIAAFFNNNNNTKPGSRRNRAHVAVGVTEGPDGELQGHVIGTGKPVPKSKLAVRTTTPPTLRDTLWTAGDTDAE